MATCKLTNNVGDKECDYDVAGLSDLKLANWHPPVIATAPAAGVIGYELDADGVITAIHLPPGENFYKVKANQGSASYSDTLLANGSGGKYRQHTQNAVIGSLDVETIKQSDALSLGTFIAVPTDKAGRARLLGRMSGITATAGGMDFNSGAADADATGWTVILQGTSTETAPLLESPGVATPVQPDPVIVP